MEPVVTTERVSKRFGSTTALRDVSFELPRGSICGLVGPNGAGKTTTLSLLLGFEAPTEGRVRVLGLEPTRDVLALKRRVGFVPEKHHIYDWMRAGQVLDFAKSLHPRWEDGEAKRIAHLLRLPLERKVKALSRGELAKLALAIALAPRPELLVLDEPTAGLDPLARREVIEEILGLLASEGRSVILSSHILSDVERIADRLLVIDHGSVVADTTPARLRERFVRASFVPTDPEEIEIPRALRTEVRGREVIAVLEASEVAEVRALAAAHGAPDVLITPLSLEDAIVEIMRASVAGRTPC